LNGKVIGKLADDNHYQWLKGSWFEDINRYGDKNQHDKFCHNTGNNCNLANLVGFT